MNQIPHGNPQMQRPLSPHTPTTSYFVVDNILIVLFLLYSFVFWNSSTLKILDYPSNSNGQVCYLKYPATYPFLYIDFTKAVPKLLCVSQCPSAVNGYTVLDSRGVMLRAPSNEQHIDFQLGGICLSNTTLNLMKSKGLYSQVQSKWFLLNKQNVALRLCGGVAGLSIIIAVFSYCLSLRIVSWSLVVLCFILMVGLLVWDNISGLFYYHFEMNLVIVALILIFGITVYLFKNKLQDSIQYSTEIKQKMEMGHDSSIVKFIKCIRLPLGLTFANFVLLVLIILQYIALASNQQLVRSNKSDLYYTVYHTWWKYLLLAIQWLFLSHVLYNFYQFQVVKTGYLVFKEQPIHFSCPSFKDIVAMYHFATLQTLLWIPLKIANLVKPQGSIQYRNDQIDLSQKVSKACYCCCGFVLNYLHKFSVDPFLVLTLQPSFDSLDFSLEIVQEVYHRADPSFDRSSQWVYRFASYINIGILSMVFVTLDSNTSNPFASSSFSNLFLIFGVIVTAELGQYFITLWSILTEVNQFSSILNNTCQLMNDR